MNGRATGPVLYCALLCFGELRAANCELHLDRDPHGDDDKPWLVHTIRQVRFALGLERQVRMTWYILPVRALRSRNISVYTPREGGKLDATLENGSHCRSTAAAGPSHLSRASSLFLFFLFRFLSSSSVAQSLSILPVFNVPVLMVYECRKRDTCYVCLLFSFRTLILRDPTRVGG